MKVKVYTLKDLDTNFLYDITDKKQLEKAKKLYPNHTIIESTTNIHYYIEISLLNKKGQEFEKGFNDKHEAIVFLNKLRRGNKLKVTSISCLTNSVLNELNYYSKELK
jgi:hypothetical protein